MNLEKKLTKLIGYELDEESAILAGALTLVSAQKIAEYNKDIDALVAIAERWLTLSRLLSDEMSERYGNIGFQLEEEIEELKDELTGNNEGKSRIKVRKKSR